MNVESNDASPVEQPRELESASGIRVLHSRDQAPIEFAGSLIVKVELVDDRWMRYTVRDVEDQSEHCVGMRSKALLSDEDLRNIALDADDVVALP